MPVMGEVVTNNSKAPTQDTIPCKIDDMNVDESQGRKTDRESFCVTEKDLDLVDMELLFTGQLDLKKPMV